MHALLLSLLVSAPPLSTPPLSTSTSAPLDPLLCEVAQELRLAILHGSDAEAPAAALGSALSGFQCLKIFALPIGFPMHGDSLPEGAARIADRIGVDWIITVSPETSPGYVTARLVETSNLQVLKAHTGGALAVAGALLRPIHDELRKSSVDGARVNLVLEPSTYGLARGFENAVRGVKNVVTAGAARIVDGKSIVVVQYIGPVEALADALQDLPIGKSKLEVVSVKLRRIEVRPILPATP